MTAQSHALTLLAGRFEQKACDHKLQEDFALGRSEAEAIALLNWYPT